MHLRHLLFAAGVMALLAVTPVQAGPLGDFNVLVFGDFSAPSSDVEGRLYAGGDVSLNSYSVGDKLTGPLVGGDSLVVGGDLTFSSGAVYNGNVAVGGSAAGVDSSVRWGLINGGQTLTDNLGSNLPVDFSVEENQLSQISEVLAAQSDTGTSEYKWSQLFLSGNGSAGRQVFSVDAADLGAASNIVVDNIADGVEVVVNVSGETASMSGGMDQFFSNNRENILFNFFEAETLSLSNIGVQGSILAVDADITTGWGVVWGQVVAESWTGPMQVNEDPFEGTVPVTDVTEEIVSIHAPGMTGILGVVAATLILLQRRRSRA